jgi:hypothetical protein
MRQASKRAGLNSTTEVKQDSSSRKGSGFAIRNQPNLATAFCRIVSRKGAVRNLVAERRVGDSRIAIFAHPSWTWLEREKVQKTGVHSNILFKTETEPGSEKLQQWSTESIMKNGGFRVCCAVVHSCDTVSRVHVITLLWNW